MAQRERILQLALELMANAGAASMSMRDLAAAADLNVATLYHYFPSKRDLLLAVLEEPRYRDALLAGLPPGQDDPVAAIEALLARAWATMTEVQGYIRVMLGEALRGDDAARGVGSDLLARTEVALQAWTREALGPLPVDERAVARLLRALVIGVYVEQLAGVDDEPPPFPHRAAELAAVLGALLTSAGAAPGE